MEHIQILFIAILISAFSVDCHIYVSPFDNLQFDKAKVNTDPAIKVTASPGTLAANGDWVTLDWSGVSKPDSDDWIGVYVLPSNNTGGVVDPKKQAPVKYQYCRYSSTHLSQGKGKFSFYMVNMRAPYVFALLRKGFSNPTLAATSNAVKFANPNEPLQGHLMLTGNPAQMKLMWVTRDVGTPEVKFSVGTSTAVIKVSATSMTYSASDMCGAPATTVGYIDPGQLHTAILDGLAPGRNVTYSFGDDKNGWSKQYLFTVPPTPDAKATTRIIAFGDMGQGQRDDTKQPVTGQLPSLNTTRLIMRDINHTDVLLHIGDVSYARGYAGVWDEFFDQIQPIATRVPYMVCVGNHERDFPNSGSYYSGTDSGGECGFPYDVRFPMPRPGRDQDWYSFRVGSVQIILMSTEHNFTVGSTQYSWIKDTLAKIDRSVTPWVVFTGHRPMYCDSTYADKPAGDIPVATELRNHIEPLLSQHKIDLALWGHHHSYQRTCPVYQEQCVKGGTVHAIIGMAGQSLSTNIRPVKPTWLEKYDIEHYGYTRITTNETTLVFEYVRDDDGQVHDTLTLTK